MNEDLSTATLVVRALGQADVAQSRALLLVEWDLGNRYADAMLNRLDAAGAQRNAESLGLLATLDTQVVGLALFGMIAGAERTAMLHGILVADELRRRGVGAALLRGVTKILRAERTRLVVAEVPDDALFLADYQSFLARHRFTREGGIPDFVRDGVGMGLWSLKE